MLKRNHRTIGHVITETPDGFTVLQTGEHQFAAAKTTELLPASSAEVEFELRLQLGELIDRARFLGISMERLEELLRTEAK